MFDHMAVIVTNANSATYDAIESADAAGFFRKLPRGGGGACARARSARWRSRPARRPWRRPARWAFGGLMSARALSLNIASTIVGLAHHRPLLPRRRRDLRDRAAARRRDRRRRRARAGEGRAPPGHLAARCCSSRRLWQPAPPTTHARCANSRAAPAPTTTRRMRAAVPRGRRRCARPAGQGSHVGGGRARGHRAATRSPTTCARSWPPACSRAGDGFALVAEHDHASGNPRVGCATRRSVGFGAPTSRTARRCRRPDGGSRAPSPPPASSRRAPHAARYLRRRRRRAVDGGARHR